MTKEDILQMARDAGIGPIYGANDESIERFAYLVAAAERKSIEPIVFGRCISDNNAQEIVNAIRERNNT